MILAQAQGQEGVTMRIWYNKTASKRKVRGAQRADREQNKWQQQALPLGNGSLGITLMGEPYDEVIIVNEKTVWTGGPSPKRPNYNGGNIAKADDGRDMKDVFSDAREKLRKGESADEECQKLVGEKDGYGAYQCAGSWSIRSKRRRVENYSCSLDFDKAESSVIWRQDSQRFARNAFVSYPDKVAVIEQTSAVACDWEVSYKSRLDAKEMSSVSGDTFILQGELDDNALKYALACKMLSDGEIISTDSGWKVQGATKFSIIFTLKTDYLDNYPTYRSGESADDLRDTVLATVANAAVLGTEKLRENHSADWKSIYGRASFSLHANEPQVSTDKLIRNYLHLNSNDKKWIEQLLFAYGRYLMASSSRKDDLLPNNLQGIWNISSNPAWGSDYHLNINLQMNYWIAPLAGLTDCGQPLVRYLDALRKPGRITASTYCGIGDGKEEKGYLYHTQNTPFGWTCPGWEFKWGWSAVAPAWILHNVYELYLFSAKEELLKEIYPMLKEATLTYDSLLDKSGERWVTSPCFSPEHGPITHGNAYEQIFLWQLYADAIDAAEKLDVDKDSVSLWKETLDKLDPIAVGDDGQILEWYHETSLGSVGEKHHRHVSHLMGLYPCAIIDEGDLKWLEATKVSLEDRGDKSTGWATALRLCLWARLYDGERAYKVAERLIANNIYQNLWDTHPPFQIDGNFGYSAAVCEMLAHSHGKAVKLLPTLPKAWSEGTVRGLGVRGGFNIDFSWKGGDWKEMSVHSPIGGEFKLAVKEDVKVTDGNVKEVQIRREDDVVSWQCEKGHVYRVCKKRS